VEDAECRRCDRGKEEESRVEAKMMNNCTGDRLRATVLNTPRETRPVPKALFQTRS
jgi:hypothetical protein